MKNFCDPITSSVSHTLINTRSCVESRRHDFFPESNPIQLSSIRLSPEDYVKPHQHMSILNHPDSKLINFEAWIVIEGSCNVDLYYSEKLIDRVTLVDGDILITYPNGGHSLKPTTDPFRMLELKNSNYIPQLTQRIH